MDTVVSCSCTYLSCPPMEPIHSHSFLILSSPLTTLSPSQSPVSSPLTTLPQPVSSLAMGSTLRGLAKLLRTSQAVFCYVVLGYFVVVMHQVRLVVVLYNLVVVSSNIWLW